MADINLGQLSATTLEKYHDTLVDNVFKKHALLNHLKENDGVKMYDGGKAIRVPVMYGTNSTVKAFSGTDTLDLTYQEGIDSAEYDYKFYDVSIVFTLTDRLMNSGRQQVIDLLKGKIRQAELSLAERLNDDLYNGAASDTKEVTGLETIVAASGTYGDIDGTTYTWWRSYVDSTSEALSFADMRTAKNTANNGNGGSRVSLVVTTQTLFEKIHSLLTASYQMNPVKEGKRLGDAGFTNIEFEGVPVVYDESCTSGAMYFINKDNYKLGIMRGADFQPIKKAEPADQHVSVQHIVFGGNSVVDRRASLAKLTGKTA